jgi:tight adherence protein B
MSPVLLISIAAFVGMAALVGGVVFVMKDFGSSKAEDRLDILAGLKTPELESHGLLKDGVGESLSGLAGMMHRLSKRFTNLGALFEQADSPIKPALFL